VAVTEAPDPELKVDALAQEYDPEPAPLAVSVVVVPEHTDDEDALAVMVGGGFTVKLKVLCVLVPQAFEAVTETI
jgi:hypothetical protein